MRACYSAFFKTILALLVFGFAAITTVGAVSEPPSLPVRLEQHVRAVASSEHNTAMPSALDAAASYIEKDLANTGYAVTRHAYSVDGQRVRNLEASLSNLRAGQRPERIFIIGAHYDSARGAPGANDNGSGTAALLELARMLKGIRPSESTELKFVFFVNEEPPYFGTDNMGSQRHARDLKQSGHKVEAALILETIGYYSNARNSQRYPPGLAALYPSSGNFIAFVGTLGSAALLRKTLAAFRAASTFPAEGLARPRLSKASRCPTIRPTTATATRPS